MQPVIELESAQRAFVQGSVRTEALKPCTLAIARGDFVAVTGRSGSGKSTLLNLVSGIDRPSGGRVVVDGIDLGGLNESALSKFRGRTIGIVFQSFELIATLSAAENVMLALDLVGATPRSQRRRRALDLLDQVGLSRHAGKRPGQLSGGEQQRVAIARALANDPPVLVADEPAGNLDVANSERIADIFAHLAEAGRTVVVATHEQSALSRFHRVLKLEDGAVVGDAA